MYIKDWSKESKRILWQLTKNGKAYTTDKRVPLEFGMRCKDILHNDFLDIAETRMRQKEKKTIFVTPPDTVIVPKKGKFFFYKIF